MGETDMIRIRRLAVFLLAVVNGLLGRTWQPPVPEKPAVEAPKPAPSEPVTLKAPAKTQFMQGYPGLTPTLGWQWDSYDPIQGKGRVKCFLWQLATMGGEPGVGDILIDRGRIHGSAMLFVFSSRLQRGDGQAMPSGWVLWEVMSLGPYGTYTPLLASVGLRLVMGADGLPVVIEKTSGKMSG